MSALSALRALLLCIAVSVCKSHGSRLQSMETMGGLGLRRWSDLAVPRSRALGGLGFVVLPRHHAQEGVPNIVGNRGGPFCPAVRAFGGRPLLAKKKAKKKGGGRSGPSSGFGGGAAPDRSKAEAAAPAVAVPAPPVLAEEASSDMDTEQQLILALLSGAADVESMGLAEEDERELAALIASLKAEQLRSEVDGIRPCRPSGVPDGAPQTAGAGGEVMMWTASPAAFSLTSPSAGEIYAEQVENVPGAMYIHNVLSREECAQLIDVSERMGFTEHDMVKNLHASCTYVADIESVIAPMFERCRPFVPPLVEVHGISREACGLNARLRVYRYQPDGKQTFRPHTDDSFPMSACVDDRLVWDVTEGKVASVFTFLLYLKEEFDGGQTNFFESGVQGKEGEELIAGPQVASVKPRTGSVLVFPQTCRTTPLGADGMGHTMDEEELGLSITLAGGDWGGAACGDHLRAPVHEGSPVVAREGGMPKYVVRSDVMYSL